jgi:hypothetical protein
MTLTLPSPRCTHVGFARIRGDDDSGHILATGEGRQDLLGGDANDRDRPVREVGHQDLGVIWGLVGLPWLPADFDHIHHGIPGAVDDGGLAGVLIRGEQQAVDEGGIVHPLYFLGVEGGEPRRAAGGNASHWGGLLGREHGDVRAADLRHVGLPIGREHDIVRLGESLHHLHGFCCRQIDHRHGISRDIGHAEELAVRG